MSRWREIQKGLIAQAITGSRARVIQKDIVAGRVYGTIYYRPDANRNRGVLLVSGIAGNRYGLGVLAERLAEYGFFCLSIDPPSHYLNPNQLSLGTYSETVTEAVILMKQAYSVHRVGVVGYSMGAVASLFSMVGYSIEIENRIYRLWEQLAELSERLEAAVLRRNPEENYFRRELEKTFVEIKRLVLYSLKKGIVEHSGVSAYVFLALPGNARQFIPGLSCLRKVRVSWTKKLIEVMLHNPSVKVMYKEGNLAKYVEHPLEPGEARWAFLTTKELPELLEYLSKMKDPKDFLKLAEDISEFKTKESNTESFFGYYLKKYVRAKPKLFVYGNLDAFLRPFLPGNRGRLEHYYKSCGNALVTHGTFTHMISEKRFKQVTTYAATHSGTTEMVLRFLDKNV